MPVPLWGAFPLSVLRGGAAEGLQLLRLPPGYDMRPKTQSRANLAAYDQGRLAAAQGKPFVVCPYPPHSELYDWWQLGWHDARASDCQTTKK